MNKLKGFFFIVYALSILLEPLHAHNSERLYKFLSEHPIEAIIFDCDGVLVDTEYLKFLAWQSALNEKGVEFSIEDYRPLVGHSSVNILHLFQQKKGVQIPIKVIDLKNKKYSDLQKKGVIPIENMVAFARSLADQKQELKLTLGLASSAPKKEILENLKQIALENIFDMILSGSDDLECYSDPEGTNKPKPYVYMEMAKRLGVEPKKCLVFEDTEVGVEAAARAGMIVVATPNQYTLQQDFSKAHQIIFSNEELVIDYSSSSNNSDCNADTQGNKRS